LIKLFPSSITAIEDCLTEISPSQIGFNATIITVKDQKFRTSNSGKVDKTSDCPIKVGPPKIAFAQIRFAQIRSTKCNLPKNSSPETGSSQINMAEIGFAQVCSSQINNTRVLVYKIRLIQELEDTPFTTFI